MAQPGTAQCFLSGKRKKRIYPELHPCERVPRNQMDACGHSLYTQGESSPVPELRQRLRSRLPAMRGTGCAGALGHSRDVERPQGQGGIPLGGDKGWGRAVPWALTGAWHQGSACCKN